MVSEACFIVSSQQFCRVNICCVFYLFCILFARVLITSFAVLIVEYICEPVLSCAGEWFGMVLIGPVP